MKSLCSRYAQYGANVAASSYAPSGVRFLRTTDIGENGQLKGVGVFLPEEMVGDCLLADGDLLISRSGTVGRSLLYDCEEHGPCAYAGYLVRFVPSCELLPEYAFYFTKSQSFVDFVGTMAISSTIDNVNGEKYANAPLPLPPIGEQTAIVQFLDRQTAWFDALIAKQQELIRLLQEKRTALISQAVTKGLDPDVAMKDSGVEWLGEIPAHWDVKRTKFAATLRSGHTPSRQKPEYWKGCTIPWFGLADVWQIRDGHVEYVQETAEKISEIGLANSSARLLPVGTVILSRTASVGFSAILGVDMATTQDFVNWVCGPSVRPEYLLCVFRAMSPEFRRLTMGSTHQTIYMHDVASFLTPVPPITEQDQIVAFVRRETAKIDAMIAKVTDAIAHLNEYRTALISAAVTGKIDIRAPRKINFEHVRRQPGKGLQDRFPMRYCIRHVDSLKRHRKPGENRWHKRAVADN